MSVRDTPRAGALLAAAAFAVQLVIIGSVIAGPLVTSMSGQTVHLRVAPVDPRDPLRGDYVAVGYDISTLHESADVKLKKGQDVWMPLRPNGAEWTAVEPVFTRQPTAADLKGVGASAAIKGRVSSLKPRTVDYGIDRYFVPEGKGRVFPTGSVIVEAKLGRDGTPVLQRLYVNGRVWP
jgi:uncharacterized membrane-anchored protein